MKKRPGSIGISVIAVALIVLADQFTKYLAVRHLKDQAPFDLIPGVFRFRFVMNEGAAFSILQNRQIFFYILTTLVLAAVIWLYLFRIPQTPRYRALNILCVTLCGGAIGNFIDRLRMRYVVDFLDFCLINFAVFNVADIFITCSCILFILLVLFYYKDEDLKGIL